MTTTIPAELTALRDERSSTQARLDEANAALPQAREQHVLKQAEQERGRGSAAEVAEAGATVTALSSEADHLVSRIEVLDRAIAMGEDEQREQAAAALKAKGAKAVSALDRLERELKNTFSKGSELIAAHNAQNEKIDSLRAEAIEAYRAGEKMAAVDESIRALADAAPPGQFLSPLIADREHQRATDAIQAGMLAAADEVASVAGDELLREIAEAAGLPAERLISQSLAAALGAGREFAAAGRPPAMAGMPGSHSVRRLYGDAELPMANARYRDFIAALDRLAIDQPSIADSYRGSAGGSTVSSAA